MKTMQQARCHQVSKIRILILYVLSISAKTLEIVLISDFEALGITKWDIRENPFLDLILDLG